MQLRSHVSSLKVHRNVYLMFALCLFTTLSACDSAGPDESIEELNEELERLLVDASNGSGVNHFTMPASNDYAAIPQDPKNPITAEKVNLGKFLYHETGLTTRPKFSGNVVQASCASCHHADAGFQAGIKQGIGVGGAGFGLKGETRDKDPLCSVDDMDIQQIRSPSTLNTAWQENMLWNGQFGATGVNVGTEGAWTPGTPKEKNSLGYEGLEIQAIAGQDVHRMDIASSSILTNPSYRDLFARAFPSIPEDQRITDETAGLAIAAYERTLLANQSPFQRWLRGERDVMSRDEVEGAIVFFGKGNCAACHNGPALSSMEFHAIGLKNLDGPGTYLNDPADAGHKGRGGFTGRDEDMHKFKVPQLYNLVDAGFYGHGASFTSIRKLIEYKNNAVAENGDVPSSQLSSHFTPLGLTDQEITALTSFIERSLRDPNLRRYVPESLPTGLCFPNNDPQSRIDRGCD